MACIKYSGRFLEPVAKTCLPISSNTTGRCSRFISNIDCNCFFALCKKNLIIIPMYSYFLMFLSTLLLYNYIKYDMNAMLITNSKIRSKSIPLIHYLRLRLPWRPFRARSLLPYPLREMVCKKHEYKTDQYLYKRDYTQLHCTTNDTCSIKNIYQSLM